MWCNLTLAGRVIMYFPIFLREPKFGWELRGAVLIRSGKHACGKKVNMWGRKRRQQIAHGFHVERITRACSKGCALEKYRSVCSTWLFRVSVPPLYVIWSLRESMAIAHTSGTHDMDWTFSVYVKQAIEPSLTYLTDRQVTCRSSVRPEPNLNAFATF